MELLAPAGNLACLNAALEAGADAVYLGLTALNARRHARNFSESELAHACELTHAHGKRVHLTLNIDLAQDELVRAARMLEFACRVKVDAVLIKDPALFALMPHFPELEYHWSTQTCSTSSADVEAAAKLGIRRVVLAREMSLAEITAASRIPGVETEVFVHGAMCFAISGRCLLSSWVGGRSGNRGQCTGPCRVPWSIDGQPCGTPFSMHDLSLLARIQELRTAGVRSVKIEGRMKNPSWVRTAVALARKAIDQTATPEEIAREAMRRGATPGRRLTDAYLDSRRHELTEHVEERHEGDEEGSADPKSAEVSLRPVVANLLHELDVHILRGQRTQPDRVRISSDLVEFLDRIHPPGGAIIEGLDSASLAHLRNTHPDLTIIAALPMVFFEEDRPTVEDLIRAAASSGVTVEVNNWAGLHLAQKGSARFMAGPGLGALNALAARELERLGAVEITASMEADALKLEALLGRTTLPCSVMVFARPALMITRVALPPSVAKGELEDRRAVKLRSRKEGSTWQLRPVQPFDLRSQRFPANVGSTVMDLVGSPDPMADWAGSQVDATRFNFDRLLS